MIQSSKPRKQRNFRRDASMHQRQKFVHVRIAKELAAKLGIKRRNTQLRRGDTVKIMSGASKGKSGKVSMVDMRRCIVFIDGITRKNAKGKELSIPVSSANVYITDLDLTDKLRSTKLTGKVQKSEKVTTVERRQPRCDHVWKRKQ